MKRLHLFELGDLAWFPKSIRDAGMDLLRFKWELGGLHKPIAIRLRDALLQTGSTNILDLASGGGGPVIAVYEELARLGCNVRITLTDKFPNLAAFKYARERTRGGVDFIPEPVDAVAVLPHLDGFRTMFTSMHHFRPDTLRRILQDAVDRQRPIGLFDFNAFPGPPPLQMLLLSTPPGVLLATPFVQPFRWSRLFWTYIVPILPLFVIWDGQVSALRLYSVRELQGIVASLPPNGYVWKIEKEPFPHPITCLIGYPGQQEG
jgi:hypothetical protein